MSVAGYTALINPISGGGRAPRLWEAVAQALAGYGCHVGVETTRSQEHAVDAARAAAERGDIVIAVGGDGLARDVACGVVPAGGTMAILPGGRGNDLVRKLGYATDPRSLAAMLAGGVTRRFDTIEADGQVVLGNVYVGIDSVANQAINDNRWLPGLLVYRLAPVGAILSWRAPTFTVESDGEPVTLRGHSIVIANSGAYGHGLQIVPSAVLDDGLLDVMTVADGPRRRIVTFMRRAKDGSHVESDSVTVRRARTVTVSADRPVPVFA
ncbi:diacylglycerol kinase family protein, partial [Jatrophihabitans sp.]|uniref:diacylglycerol/lipid kinase family protein n=1 Tax=Jatrophihabitans sp. TaxID=1932789 RepID=UPI0030C726D3|nr:Transcription regulator [Jatrophihabitans sp.]